jgi:hypothetical protein
LILSVKQVPGRLAEFLDWLPSSPSPVSSLIPAANAGKIPCNCREPHVNIIPFLYLQYMKYNPATIALMIALLVSCNAGTKKDINRLPINGTWQLISGTTITGKDSTVTDYTKGQRMIKIINDDHFAFLKHDLNAPADSSNNFDAGGGSYTLAGDAYTEHLDYYKDRNWEGKAFNFTVSIQNDTLIQKGIEKVEKAGIDREIIEKYVRVQ